MNTYEFQEIAELIDEQLTVSIIKQMIILAENGKEFINITYSDIKALERIQAKLYNAIHKSQN